MNSFQLTMPVLGNVKRECEILPSRLEYLLDDLQSERQAILFAIQRAGRTQTVVGEELGLKQSHWSGIVNGNKNMSWNLMDKFSDLLGNDLLLQWKAKRRGYRLVRLEPTEQEKLQQENERLKAELAQAKREAAGK